MAGGLALFDNLVGAAARIRDQGYGTRVTGASEGGLGGGALALADPVAVLAVGLALAARAAQLLVAAGLLIPAHDEAALRTASRTRRHTRPRGQRGVVRRMPRARLLHAAHDVRQ